MARKKRIPAIDLFSGCGGVTSGLNKSGFFVKAAIEIDKDAIETYNMNFPKTPVIKKDIRNVTGTELLSKANINKEELFLLAGCPPCQNFSLQNRNRDSNNTERKQLLFEYVRLVFETNPTLILMENVPGIMAENNQQVFNKLIEELEKRYVIVRSILNAADYGVPQRRKRFVLHGLRKDLAEVLKQRGLVISLPAKTHIDPAIKQRGGGNKLHDWRTVRQTIGDLPVINAGEKYQSETIKNHACMNLEEINLERIRYIREHGGSRRCLPTELSLDCHKEYSGHTDVYGIMDWNKPALTITGGCLYYSKGRFGHPSQNRAISAREAARLQTFDDSFIFTDNLTKAGMQIGNAVPVVLVKASGQELQRIGLALRDLFPNGIPEYPI